MKIERTELIKVLDQVKPALATAGSIPELKHIWLDGKFLYAYNGALGIRIAWESELKPCGIPGGVLLGLLNSSSAKELEIKQESTQCDLKMGRASATVPVFKSDANPWPFPAKVPPGPVGVRSIPLTEELLAGLRQVRIIRASKPVRVEHHGVVLFPSTDALVLYTTDSHALAEVPVKGKWNKELAKVVLPHGFVSQLLGLKAGAKVSVLKDAIIAEAPGIQVCSNLLDSADVWDLPALVDTKVNGKEKRMIVPEAFAEGLERALVLAGSDLENAFVELSVNKKELTLSGRFDQSLLDEKFTLKALGEGKISVDLERLKGLYKETEEFAISKSALLLFGKDDALYLVAAHEGKK